MKEDPVRGVWVEGKQKPIRDHVCLKCVWILIRVTFSHVNTSVSHIPVGCVREKIVVFIHMVECTKHCLISQT